jgi:hypothetical protein
MSAPRVFYSSSTSLQILHLRNPFKLDKTVTAVHSAESEDSKGASQPVTRK